MAELLAAFFLVVAGLAAVWTSDQTVAAGFFERWAVAIFLGAGAGISSSISAGTVLGTLEVDGVGLAGRLRARLGSVCSRTGSLSSKRTFLILGGADTTGDGDLDEDSDELRSVLLC